MNFLFNAFAHQLSTCLVVAPWIKSGAFVRLHFRRSLWMMMLPSHIYFGSSTASNRLRSEARFWRIAGIGKDLVAGDLNPSRWRTGAARSLSKARKRSPKAESAAVGAAGASPLSPCSRISSRLPKISPEMCARASTVSFCLSFFVECCVLD